MVFALTDEITFPDPHYGDPDGLLAVGGDLSTDRLILAYSNGIFPWYTFQEGMIQWWCPLERFVIFPDEVHISHSMRTLMNKGKYDVTINQAFDEVIRKCGELRMDMEGAWLGPEMIEAYTLLHEQGFAASVEIWEEEQLVGGLYGVTLGRCFFGESMFSLVPSASKLALIHLAQFFGEHRLSVRNSPSEINGRKIYQLRRIYGAFAIITTFAGHTSVNCKCSSVLRPSS